MTREKNSTVHHGDLNAEPGKVYEFTEITGWLNASGADTRTAFPQLTTVGGWLSASGADTRTAFPQLTTVGGWLSASGADTRTAFPQLTTVGGWLDASGADTKTAFPKLTTVGGGLDARGADTKTAFPKLTTVGGGLDARGADTKTAFPKLTTVGGGLYARGVDTKTAFPKLAHQNDQAALIAALARKGLALHDGILSKVIAKRGAVTRVRVIGQKHTSYVVTDGAHSAHGATLAEARADLRLKQGDRDVSAFAGWTPETVVSMEDGIAAYRAVTGACGAGVRQFLVGRKLPSKMPVSRILSETVGQYGAAQFAAFISKHKGGGVMERIHDHEADALPQAAGSMSLADYVALQDGLNRRLADVQRAANTFYGKRIICTSKRGPAFSGDEMPVPVAESAAVLFGRLCLHLHRQQWRDAVSVYLRLKATYGVPHAVPVEVTQLAGLGSIPWWETAAATAANLDAVDARRHWYSLACVMLTIGIKQVEQLDKLVEFAEVNDGTGSEVQRLYLERRFFAEFVANMQGNEAA